jgi:nucleotide-binding universal stress UspA family protein
LRTTTVAKRCGCSATLPLLVRAQRVELVLWSETGSDDNETLQARLDAVHRWLVRHGVASHGHIATLHAGIAEATRKRAAEMGADLIVMGAYGHARWAERVLGGAPAACSTR